MKDKFELIWLAIVLVVMIPLLWIREKIMNLFYDGGDPPYSK